MYYDDFIAQQVMKTKDPWSSHAIDARQPTRRPLRALWSGVRQLARSIGALRGASRR